MHLASAVFQMMPALREDLEVRLRDVATVEGAARACADCLYGALESGVVLARVFFELPVHELPPVERERAEAAGPLADTAPVLVLMGSRGVVPAWNDRRASARHLAMPLARVGEAPMVASLLRDLGVEVPRIGETRPQGPRTFYVLDARTTTDEGGRATISDRAFVEEHDVRSVFGVGGSAGGRLFAVIVFARQHVTRSIADQLLPISETFAACVSRTTALFEPR